MRNIKIIAIAVIMSVFLFGCATGHGTSPKGLEIPIEKATIKFSSDIKAGGYKVVDTDQLKKWLDEGKSITIISALPAAEDKGFGTLPKAVSGALPKTEKELTPADSDNLLKVAGADKDKTIVIYCGFVACRRSHIGAKILVDNGFQNVYRYPGGITAWKEAGNPVTK
jgi:thiosulfate/3-mercaptopyruvate sulfurtransferase